MVLKHGLAATAAVAATLFLGLGLVDGAHARTPDGRLHANVPPRPSVPKVGAPTVEESGPVTSRNGTVLPPYNTTYYFDQLIDHNNPSKGTFKQRYWHTYEWYESGGPIILFTPGESNAAGYDGYLTNRTINGQIAQQESGATIVLEHRFYGLSNPLPDLSVASLKLHTIQQAIDDLEYFAQNVKLPQPDGGSVAPGKAPWVLIGGSYSGALTSFTVVNKPDLFQAAYASSAVVESITDFWGYFQPILEYMPKNCSSDVLAVIEHLDSVYTSKDTAAIHQLLSVWNFTLLANHLDDAAGALRNPLWAWQDLSPDSGYGTFNAFCDALEVKNGVSASSKGWGLQHALQAWGSWWNQTYYPQICGGSDQVSCLGTYDSTASYWTDTAIDNAGRSWNWIVCNEVGFYQESAPVGHPTLVSRLMQPAYDERQCTYMFPEAFPQNGPLPQPRVEETNLAYDGWFVQTDNLFFANGHRDPWREATKATETMVFFSTPEEPLAISDGFHCSDLITQNGVVDSTVLSVQQQALQSMKSWIAEWEPFEYVSGFGGF